ncbi:hypothetical protein B5G43_06460 [Flavonifractor sp. An92]|uniref:MerR family transcriptional regulator n=1 Tax=Flavonifractor sp. An92 TaxID=1965666 RepID=UPI000B390A4C|nr:MerR family transcriptional regulator [Flavonifractor sp. An92]OUN07245.1 hypothetical protein B5G43_06460 [Flavonifractor sp. An92]
MTIKELEQRLDLPRASVRYYEQEGLLHPGRGANNYRDYTEEDLCTLEKVKLLRQLHLEVDTIRRIQAGELSLKEALDRQLGELSADQTALERSFRVCRALRAEGESYDALDPRPWLRELERDVPPPAPHFPQPRETQPPPSVAPNPIRRWGARFLDLSICALPWVILSTALHIQLPDNLIVTWLKSYPAYLLLLLVEPLLLHTWGYTPGKWLLGLKVRDRNGEKLTLRRARQRAWRLFGRGEGYNIPIYNIIREWKSYRACRDGEPMPWDSDDALPVEEDLSYVAEELKVRQFVGWVAAVVAILVLTVQVGFFALLPPCRGDLTVTEFSRNYNYYASLLDQDVPALDENGVADSTWSKLLDSALGWYQPNLTLETDETGKVTGFTVTWVSRPDAGVYGVPDQAMVNVLAASLLGAREGWWAQGFMDDILDFSGQLSDLPMEGSLSIEGLSLERKLDVRAGKLTDVSTNHDFYKPVGTEDVHALLTLTARIPE